MPGTTGLDFAKIINDDFTDLNIPIVFVSARSDLESFVEGFEIGAAEYITKPFEREKVIKIVEEKLNSSN